MTYINIGQGGAEQWRVPVTNLIDLPAAGSFVGEARLVTATGGIYYWTGAAWVLTSATVSGPITDLIPETSGAAAAAGKIGEVLEASAALANVTAATGTYGNAVSLALTAGVWELSGVAIFSENSSTLTTSFTSGFSDSATGIGIGANDIRVANDLIYGTVDSYLNPPPKLVNIAAGTTYYLNTRLYFSAGTPQHGGRITARRYR